MMAKPSSPNPHIANLKMASNKLKSLLESGALGDGDDVLQIIPVAAVMINTVSCVEQIADAVSELSFMADFKIKSRSRSRNGVEGESEMGKEIEIGTAEIPSLCITIDSVGLVTQSSAEAGIANQILMV